MREGFLIEYETGYCSLSIIEVFRTIQKDRVRVILIGGITEPSFKNKLFGFVKDVKTIKTQ